MLFVGIDLSKTSPAVVADVRATGTHTCFEAAFLCQSKRRSAPTETVTHRVGAWRFHEWPRDPTGASCVSGCDKKCRNACASRPYSHRFHTYQHIFARLVAFFDFLATEHHSSGANTQVAIEQMAFSAAPSQATTALIELSAIVKYWLTERGFYFEEIMNNTAKMVFAGKGNATKAEMYNAWEQKHRDMFADFSPVMKMPAAAPLAAESPVAHPLQDIIDALAMTYTFQNPPKPASHRKKRKRLLND